MEPSLPLVSSAAGSELATPLPVSPAVLKPAAATVSAQRIDALDWTKGALILFMVAYHAINYSAFRPLAFKYLAFLPPSFILITGFLVGQVYATKYDLASWKPYLRLSVRGMKLLLLFVVLNVLHCILLERSLLEGFWEFADRASTIFLSGNGREGVFEVLLPISYFLLLAPMLLWLRSKATGSVAVFALLVCLGCALMARSGHSAKNMFLLTAGFMGMALGLIRIDLINRIGRLWVPVLLLYLLYRWTNYRFGEIYVVQMFGAAASVFLLYCCALHLRSGSWFFQQMVTFGKYSLLAYLAQIVLLQIVVKAAGGKPTHLAGVVLVGFVTGGLLLVLIRAAHVVLQKHPGINSVYRSIFA